MKNPVSRTNGTQILSDLSRKEDEMEKSKVHWRNQSEGGYMDSSRRKIELVIPTSTGVSELFRFAIQLNKNLRQSNSYGDLVRIVPSQFHGTVFEIFISPFMLNRLLDNLSSMPEVEGVDEGPNGGALPSYPRKFGVLLHKALSPQVDLQNLEETDMARQGLVAV